MNIFEAIKYRENCPFCANKLHITMLGQISLITIGDDVEIKFLENSIVLNKDNSVEIENSLKPIPRMFCNFYCPCSFYGHRTEIVLSKDFSSYDCQINSETFVHFNMNGIYYNLSLDYVGKTTTLASFKRHLELPEFKPLSYSIEELKNKLATCMNFL